MGHFWHENKATKRACAVDGRAFDCKLTIEKMLIKTKRTDARVEEYWLILNMQLLI